MADLDVSECTQGTVKENNLEYIAQSKDSYTVKLESGKELTIAKAYSRSKSNSTKFNFHAKWLQIASFGLPIGGLLTVILCPLVIWNNVVLLKNENLTANERTHSINLIIVSAIFLLLGVGVFALFIMHLLY